MPNSSITLVQDSANTTGNPVRLSYGYNLGTGQRLAYNTLQNTASNWWTSGLLNAGPALDWSRVGFWGLGEGPQNGCVQLNMNGTRLYNSEFDDLATFHYHTGTDAIIGSGFALTSQGPDQGVDTFWQYMPAAITPLHYSRLAYYALFLKYPSVSNLYGGTGISATSGSGAENGNDWADLNPLGVWRGLSCRIFDNDGNQTASAFTVNPCWHWIDLMCRRRIKPDFLISLNGLEPLTTAEADCFDFDCNAQTAAYFDQRIRQSDGTYRRRFEHHGTYDGATGMTDALTKILTMTRSYVARGAGGKLQLICDEARPSQFFFDRTMLSPGSYAFDDKKISADPNQIRAKFRSLLVPAFGKIESITLADHGNPIVQIYPNTIVPSAVPCVAGDYVWIGGTRSNYDREWRLVTPQPSGLATDGAGNVIAFAVQSLGSDFPASWQDSLQPVPFLALAGLTQSRFKERTVPFDHKANQFARGAIAPGVPRQRAQVPQDLDLSTTTFDQAERVSLYEKTRSLGNDTYVAGAWTGPYQTPAQGKLAVELLAKDKFGNMAIGLRPGDRVTILPDVNYPNALDYEVMDGMEVRPYTAKASGTSLAGTPDGGEITFPLQQYNPSAFVDASNLADAGWQDVPDSDPDNGAGQTNVPLADGGTLAFISGGMQSGGVVQLPSGFPSTQWMGVTSPQGFIDYGHPLHIIRTEQINQNLQVTLNYTDGEGNIWPGNSSYFVCAWRSTSSTTYSTASAGPGSINPQWLEATLAGSGAEQILIGVLQNYGAGPGAPAGTPSTIALPPGWEFAQCIAVAFPYTNGGPAPSATCHTMSCTVDGAGNCTFVYSEPSTPNYAYGPVQVFLLAYKNNGGTVTDTTTAGVRCVTIPVGTTDAPLNFMFCTAVLSDQSPSNPAPDNPTALVLPTGVAGTSLQAIASPYSFEDDGQDCHGVRALYLDEQLGMNASVEDGEGHIAYGDGTVLAVLCE